MKLRNRFLARALAYALAPLLLGACTDEGPTDVGDVLLPSGDVLTFEVLLPASAFLVSDSSFSGYNQAFDATFGLIANSFENVVDANTLLRFSLAPRTITVRTTGTTTVVDSAPRYPTARMVVKFDTLGSTARPVRFTLYRTAEPWDVSATWTNRVDTLGAALPWATPGGTRGATIDTATWTAGDSVAFTVDSATLAVWNDSTDRARGAILVAETEGARSRMLSAIVHVAARSSVRADTVVNVDLVPAVRTFVSNPTLAPNSGSIRVGGIPTWRSFLRFREDLRTLRFPCNNGQAGCTVSLDSAHVNRAQLLLKPAQTPAGFLPEDSVFIEARMIAVSPQVPIERSPLTGDLPIVRSQLMAPSLFRSPPAEPIRLDITGFMAHLLDESILPANRRAPWLVLMQIPEAATAGFATFDDAAVLRLILTTTIGSR
jgi:hypothetical protein